MKCKCSVDEARRKHLAAVLFDDGRYAFQGSSGHLLREAPHGRWSKDRSLFACGASRPPNGVSTACRSHRLPPARRAPGRADSSDRPLAEDLEPAIAEVLASATVRGHRADARTYPGDDAPPSPEHSRMCGRRICQLAEAWLRSNIRLADLALLEQAVDEALPPQVLSPRRLRDLSLRHVQRAATVLGDVQIEPCLHIAPIWRRAPAGTSAVCRVALD